MLNTAWWSARLDVPAGAVIEPQASSLEEVAKAKIRQAMDHLPHHNAVVLVEDAGLFVDALDGFPGVYSSYVHDTVGNLGMIRLLSHLQSEDPVRQSAFVQHRSKPSLRCGTVKPSSSEEASARVQSPTESQGEGGFGYDPIFVPLDLDEHGEALDPGTLGAVSTHGQTFGVVDVDTKHRFSHRRRALDDLIAQAQHLLDR